MTARVHDECFRRQQRFDLLEPEDPLPATRGQARSGRVQDEVGAFYLRRQRRDACVVRCALGPSERSASRLRPEASNRDPRDHQLVGGPRRGREGRGVELGEGTLGFVDAPDQEQAPDLEISRVRRVDPVGVRFERRPRCGERLRRPAEVARDERDLGLGDGAPRGATTSFGPKARAALRRRAFARTRSPSCAIAMPRSARAGASSRRATRFNAPRGSPAASARAAAVVSESIGIPSHL